MNVEYVNRNGDMVEKSFAENMDKMTFSIWAAKLRDKFIFDEIDWLTKRFETPKAKKYIKQLKENSWDGGKHLIYEVVTNKKYAKIVKNSELCQGGASVLAFIVKEDDGKFKRGDILKPANWNSPAKNFARGNIFDDDLKVSWYGF